jgi:hypothetical protein
MKKLLTTPEVVAAFITVMGTFLVGIILSYLEGRIGFGTLLAALAALLLVLLVYLLYRLAGPGKTAGSVTVMLVVGFLVFVILGRGPRQAERTRLPEQGTVTTQPTPTVQPPTIPVVQTATEPVAPALPNTVAPTEFPPPETTRVVAITEAPAGPLIGSFPAPAAGPFGVARIGDDLLVRASGRLYRLDLNGNIVEESDFDGPCFGGIWDGQSLWCVDRNSVHQLSPPGWQDTSFFETELVKIVGLAWDGSLLWVIDEDGDLAGYDRAGQRMRRLAVPANLGDVEDLVWVEGEFWVVDVFNGVLRYDSQFNVLGSWNLTPCGATFPYAVALFWDGESLWLANANDHRIYRCAPSRAD